MTKKLLNIILIIQLLFFANFAYAQWSSWDTWSMWVAIGDTIYTAIANLNMDLGSGNITTTGTITAEDLASTDDGIISDTLTVGTLTDGTLSINSGNLTTTGILEADTLTDGTLKINAGNITGALNIIDVGFDITVSRKVGITESGGGQWFFINGDANSLTADRILTFSVGDADRTLTLSGNPTLGDWFDQSVLTTASPAFDSLTLTSPTQDYLFSGDSVALYLQSQTSSRGNLFQFFSKDGDGTDTMSWGLYGVGVPATVTSDFEALIWQWDTTNDRYNIFTGVGFISGTVRPLRIYTGANTDQIILYTDGAVRLNGANFISSKTSTTHYIENYHYRGVRIVSDSYKFYWGHGYDGTIHHDGTNFIFNPKNAGSGYMNVQGDLIVDDNIGIGTTSPDTTLQVVGTSGFGDDAGNELLISATGVVTMAGTAKRELTLRADLDYTTITAQGKPTQVIIGIVHGYSMPIYTAGQNEELFFNENVPGRWDATSDITFDILVALASAESADETFTFEFAWNQVGETDVIPATFHIVEDEVTVVDGTQYATYYLHFIVDYDTDSGDAVIAHDDLNGRLRRIASSGDEVDGEVIVLDWHTHYTVDKMFKVPE